MRGVLLLAATAMILSGCADSGHSPEVQVITSIEPDAVAVESGEVELDFLPSGGVAGLVVDPSYTPIAGVTVRIPGMERETQTNTEGQFGLANIPAGGLFLLAERDDYHPASVEVIVPTGDIVKVTFVLEVDFKEPFIQVQEFEGYTEFVSDPFTGWNTETCNACSFQVTIADGADSVVVEVISSRPGNPDPLRVADDRRFYQTVQGIGESRRTAGYEGDPFRLEWDGSLTLERQSFRLDAYPQEMIPETAVSFEVFVASFHNGADPEAWSMLEGRA